MDPDPIKILKIRFHNSASCIYIAHFFDDNNSSIPVDSSRDHLDTQHRKSKQIPIFICIHCYHFFQGECQVDDECALTEACEDYYCKNPCKPDTCQKEYFCKVIRHIPTCGLQYVPEEPEV